MKRAFLILFVITLSMIISIDAATTGVNPTQYDYTVSNLSPIKDESVTIDTHVQIWETDHFVDMYEGMGEMRHHLLSYDSSVGSVQTTGEYTYDLSSSLDYEFTLDTDRFSLFGIKVPLSVSTDDSQFVSGTSITVQLFQDTTRLLGFDIVDWEIIPHLTDNEGLFIPINTVYTLMNQHDTGLDLFKDTLYSLEFDFLNFPSGTTVQIPADPGYSTEISIITGTVQAYAPGIVFYSGTKLGETRTGPNGMHSIDLSMVYGTYYYTATFFDEMTNWQRFMYIQEFNIVDLSNPYIDTADTTFDYGDNIMIDATARVDLGGAVLVNQEVNLYEKNGAVFDFVAMQITNTMGQISLSLPHINQPGIHEFMLETYYNLKRATKLVLITLNEPLGQYSGLKAVGYFSSAGIDSTRVTVEGYVIQQSSSNPVAEEEFEIYMNTSLIQTVSTDSTGYIAFDIVVNDPVGVYTNMMSIRYTGDVWGILDDSFDLQILKGMPTIDIMDVAVSYIEQPFSFIGFVTDMSINPLQVDASLEYFDGQNWINDGSVTIAADGSLSGSSAAIQDAGQYVYQIRTVENPIFRSVTKAFNVLIDATDMSISRGGLDDPYYVEYHENGDFSVLLLDSNFDPVVGESVTFSTNDVTQGTIIDLATVITDVNGIAQLNWIIPDVNLALIYSPMEMIANHVGNFNYASTSFVFEYYLVPTTLEATIDPGLTEFNSISTIVIDINDIHDFDIKEGIDFIIGIDGSVYNLVSDINGELIFTHEYDLVGLSTFVISYDRATQLTENGFESFIHTEQINIDKGTFNIVMDDLFLSQGSYYDMDIYVEDVNLNPVEGVAVEVLLYNNILWTTIHTGSSSPMGVVAANLLAELAPGIYSYKVVIAEGNQYYGATETKLFVVEDITTRILESSVPDSYFYGSADISRYVELHLVVDNLNQPLSGKVLTTEFGSLSFSNTTDANGMISFHLPQFETPGIVTLTVSFLENGVHRATQLVLDILVDGVDTIIDWIQLPTDTYYGEILSTSVVVTDNLGNPLVNYEVVLTINDLSYSRYSDINGEVYFSIELRTDLGLSTVQVELQGTLGFDPASISLDINHDKRDLEMDVTTSSGLLESQFSYPTEFTVNPYVIIDSVIPLDSCIIEVYWADVMGGTWILIDTIIYDGNPFSVVLPKQDVGVTQFLKFVAIESNYHPVEVLLNLVVVQGPVYSDVSSTSSTFGDNISITFVLSNYYGNNLADMQVELRYMDPYTSQLLFSMIMNTDENGVASFVFVGFDSGDLQFDYVVGDGNGNYAQSAGVHTVSVIHRSSVSSIYFASFAGQGHIYANITDSQNGIGVDGIAEIYIFDGSDWILQQTINVNDGFAYYTLINLETSNDYYVMVHSMSGYNDIEQYLTLDKQVLTVDISEQTLQTQLDTSIIFTITGDTNLDGMYVIVSYYDNSNWVGLGTIYLDSIGTSTDQLRIDLVPGYYDLRLYIPEQIWFEEKIVFEVMHVVKKQVNLVYDPINIYSNISASVLVNTVDDNSDIIEGVEIEMWMDNELIASAASIDGIAELLFTLDLSLGEYEARILVLSDDVLASGETPTTIYVWREANIDYSVIENIIYTDGGVVSVKVTDFDTGDPISDASVSLAYKYLFEWINLGSAVSNETGMATVYVGSIVPGSYIMRASMTQVDIYGSVSIEKSVTVLPETIDMEFEMVNFGISHNRTISFDLFDESDDITEGNIYWKIMTSNGQVFDQGSFDIKETNELILPGDLIGDYYLSVTYGHDSNYFVYNSQLIIQDIGFDQLYTKDISIGSNEVDYLDTEIALQITANGSSISGISVLVFTNHTGYINLETDINGYIHIPINYTLPGQYSIRIEILSSIYFSGDFAQDVDVMINRAEVGFDAEIPETVYFSDGISVIIEDTYLNSSSYEVRIITAEGYLLNSSYWYNTSVFEIDYELSPGEYVLAVFRFNDLLIDELVKQNILVVEKPVVIKIYHVVNPDSDTVDLIITGLFDNTNIDGVSYNITIHNGGVFHYVVNSSLTINVFGTGTMEVTADAMSPYSGENELMIKYDVTTVEITEPEVVGTEDTPVESEGSLFGEIIGSLAGIGAIWQSLPILRKKFGK